MKNIKATSEILSVYNNMLAKADKLTDEKLRDEALAEAENTKTVSTGQMLSSMRMVRQE